MVAITDAYSHLLAIRKANNTPWDQRWVGFFSCGRYIEDASPSYFTAQISSNCKRKIISESAVNQRNSKRSMYDCGIDRVFAFQIKVIFRIMRYSSPTMHVT